MVKGNHDDKIINKPLSSISNVPPNVTNPPLQQVELDTLDPNSDNKKNTPPVCLPESDSIQPFRLNSNYNVDDDDEFLLKSYLIKAWKGCGGCEGNGGKVSVNSYIYIYPMSYLFPIIIYIIISNSSFYFLTLF